MLKLIISLMFAIAIANSAELKPKNSSVLSQESKVFVNFEAHKTPSKKAVKGQFEDVKFTPASANGNTFREVFLGASFMINSKSAVIHSKEKEEKENELMKFFFDNMNITNIGARIVAIKPDKIVKGKPKTGKFSVDIYLNGVVRNIPMDYKFNSGELSANGIVDVSAFNSKLIFELVNQEFLRQKKERVSKNVNIAFSTKIKPALSYAANR
ncbi:MAG: hypothetical protein FP820_03420 [Sulfurimonas sp.]|nr:hypothetical protein [Sulfurimonas sp.]MBU3937973.1 hypothetical protein [bacterium]MBU4024011.1 hypothetical protein [bacterium]MBU4058478.1 hypothetical protein [bacterium]